GSRQGSPHAPRPALDLVQRRRAVAEPAERARRLRLAGAAERDRARSPRCRARAAGRDGVAGGGRRQGRQGRRPHNPRQARGDDSVPAGKRQNRRRRGARSRRVARPHLSPAHARPVARLRPAADAGRDDGVHPAAGWCPLADAHARGDRHRRDVPREAAAHDRGLPRLRGIGPRVRRGHQPGPPSRDVVRAALTATLALVLAPAALALPLRAGFTPSDPLAPKQYYLTQDHTFDAFGPDLPVVNPVRVAIIDSGLDGGHPEFPRARIWQARSWVGGSPLTDEEGHGTFVAGMIAAAIGNNEGIAGMAFPAQLVI